jgi:nitrite reductase/ring-hydroxylating ferredoxin subunit
VSFTTVGPLSELPPGRCRSVRIGVRRVAVWNVGGTLHAMEDACRHMKAPLSTGRLEGTVLTCAWHGWKYDVTSGACLDPSWACVRRFPVKVENGMILVSGDEIPRAGGEDDPEEEIPTPVFRS